MPKFKVCLGRLVRETATVIVEAPDQASLETKLGEVYESYEGSWEADTEWGCEPSDSHSVWGEANPRSAAQVTIK